MCWPRGARTRLHGRRGSRRATAAVFRHACPAWSRALLGSGAGLPGRSLDLGCARVPSRPRHAQLGLPFHRACGPPRLLRVAVGRAGARCAGWSRTFPALTPGPRLVPTCHRYRRFLHGDWYRRLQHRFAGRSHSRHEPGGFAAGGGHSSCCVQRLALEHNRLPSMEGGGAHQRARNARCLYSAALGAVTPRLHAAAHLAAV